MKPSSIAHAHAATLPSFGSQRAARSALLRERDEALARLHALTSSAELALDTTVESLGRLESWYLDVHRRRGWSRLGTTRREVERAMSYYVGSVAKRAVPGARWVVEKYALGSGSESRYEIGIEVGHSTVMVAGMCDDWHRHAGSRAGALLRSFRRRWETSAKPRVPGKKSETSDEDIRTAILAKLALKSSSRLLGGELWVAVRHRLRDPRIRAARVSALLAALVDEGRLGRAVRARGKEEYFLAAR